MIRVEGSSKEFGPELGLIKPVDSVIFFAEIIESDRQNKHLFRCQFVLLPRHFLRQGIQILEIISDKLLAVISHMDLEIVGRIEGGYKDRHG